MGERSSEHLQPLQGGVERLQAHSLPLSGLHLIEASAGTGKTFNITRIYIRLLLERRLKVQNILVVTFTKAATEELRGRIDAGIRDTLQGWGKRDPDDDFYKSLEVAVTEEDASVILKEALVNMDDAAIFTIHGFCKRVLSQQAFSSGLPFDLDMEADSHQIKLDATRDWYRTLKRSEESYLLISEHWPTPEAFVATFGSLLVSEGVVKGNNPNQVLRLFERGCKASLEVLLANEVFVFTHLIDPHKDKTERTDEFTALTQWLSEPGLTPMPKTASAVFNGTRYSRKSAEIKDQLNILFNPLKALNKQSQKLDSMCERAKADDIVVNAIKLITQEVVKRKHQLATLDFDDLIIELLHAVQGVHGKSLVKGLLSQYPVALVDEFQDTDPYQYEIFKQVYKRGGDKRTGVAGDDCALYMIGDPKQAIYGFRGGDVFACLSARNDADRQWYMDTNWRSSTALIKGYNRLFYGEPTSGLSITSTPRETTHIFKYGIGYIPVNSSKTKDDHWLANASRPPLRYVYFDEHEDYGKGANNQSFRAVIADWCASEISSLLDDQTGPSALNESDIAILVRDRSEAEDIQASLRQQGRKSVYLSTRENVFDSEEARELLRLLIGILLAENNRLLVAALSTRFMGFDSNDLLNLQSDEVMWEETRATFINMRSEWEAKGVMSTLFSLIQKHHKPDPDRHERALTNTIHLLELLQQAAQKHRQPWELLAWFRDNVLSPAQDTASELRLDSDSNLIKIITLHGAKGLEYPVVFIPFSTRAKSSGPKKPAYYRFHEEGTNAPVSFIGYDNDVKECSENERLAEDIRLLYVAITRAGQICYVCATPFSGYETSPLGLMLGLTTGADLKSQLLSLVSDTPDSAELLVADLQVKLDTMEYRAEMAHSLTPTAERFDATIDDGWWVASFSAIVRNVSHEKMAELDRDVDTSLDELTGKSQLESQDDNLRFVLNKGALTGNLLHDVLENVDFNCPDWAAAAEAPLLRFGLLEEQRAPALYDWLGACLDTELLPGMALSQLTSAQTLKETEFYFPTCYTKIREVVIMLQRHRSVENPLSLPDGLVLNGMMHGFVDLIFEWNDKYYIVDYKSNHLGDSFESYSREMLAMDIQNHYYDLQYLIYSVALHRYLSVRLDGYDPSTHLGGVYYLYLRGMSPSSQTGIYHTQLSSEFIGELDGLFGRAEPL